MLLVQDNPGKPTVALVVNFYPPDGSKVIPSLVMSPAAEKLVIVLTYAQSSVVFFI